MRMRPFRSAWSSTTLILVLWTFLYALIAFANLGGMEMWNDEGLMALGGERVLQFGYPKAWDGRTLFSFEAGYDLNSNLVQIRMPWLGFYLAAAGMKIFGTTVFGARFMFTLFGVLNLPLAFLFCRKMELSPKVSLLAVFILSSLCSYWLYIRQCYHYPVDVTFSLLALLSYLHLKKSWAPFAVAASILGIFFLNYMTALWILISLILFSISEKEFTSLARKPSTWIAGSLMSLLMLGWISWARVTEYGNTLGGWRAFKPHFSRLGFVLSELDMTFPLLFLIPFFTAGFFILKEASSQRLLKLTACTFTPFLLLASHELGWLRYYVTLFVLFGAVAALLLADVWKKSRPLAVMIGAAFFLTTIPYQISHQLLAEIFTPFKKYELQRTANLESKLQWVSPMLIEVPQEIRQPAITPVGEVVAYLNEHAKPDDKIVSLYESEILAFKTKLIPCYLVDPRQYTYPLVKSLPGYITSWKEADWLLLRRSWKRSFGMREFDYDQNVQIFTGLANSGAKLERIPLKIRERFPNQLPTLFGHTWSTDYGPNAMGFYRVVRTTK